MKLFDIFNGIYESNFPIEIFEDYKDICNYAKNGMNVVISKEQALKIIAVHNHWHNGKHTVEDNGYGGIVVDKLQEYISVDKDESEDEYGGEDNYKDHSVWYTRKKRVSDGREIKYDE